MFSSWLKSCQQNYKSQAKQMLVYISEKLPIFTGKQARKRLLKPHKAIALTDRDPAVFPHRPVNGFHHPDIFQAFFAGNQYGLIV